MKKLKLALALVLCAALAVGAASCGEDDTTQGTPDPANVQSGTGGETPAGQEQENPKQTSWLSRSCPTLISTAMSSQ
jgi:hypothetical protein